MALARDPEELNGNVTAADLARELRERVGDQLHDLVIERRELGSQGEFVRRVQRVGYTGRELTRANGRIAQAREMGLPLAALLGESREAEELLREAVISVGEAAGAWAAQMDFEKRRRTDATLR